MADFFIWAFVIIFLALCGYAIYRGIYIGSRLGKKFNRWVDEENKK